MGTEKLLEVLSDKRIVVLVGAGGVGKTTISASLGLFLADEGKKVLVLTIDPARRLADSVGIRLKGNEPVHVYSSKDGKMSAMMLDSKKTFDSMIERFVDNEETKRTILNNQYYQYVSTLVTGSHEYMSLERLLELFMETDFDTIILDTPPSRNAEDFLEAPKSVLDVLDSGVLNLFISSYSRVVRLGLRTFRKGLKGISRILEGIVGIELLEGIADFLLNFEGLYGGFRERAERVFSLLREDFTTFFIVATPEDIRINESRYFCQKLKDSSFKVSGIIFNRALPRHRITREETDGFIFRIKDRHGFDQEEILKLISNYEKLLDAEERNINETVRALKLPLSMKVYQMDRDVHNIDGLKNILSAIEII